MPVRPLLLVVTSTYPRWPGDPEPRFVHELSRRLQNRFQVHVLGPHAPGAKCEEQMDGVHVHRYRYAPTCLETLVNHGGMLTNVRRAHWKWLLVPGFLLAQYVSLRRLIRELRPQVVHAHWLLPQGLVAAAVTRATPWVGTSHGADLFALNGGAFVALRRWIVRRAAAVTLVSSAMRDRLLSQVPESRAWVMPMGVDTAHRFTPGGERASSELLFVGRLVEKKGLVHLLQALPLIERECPGTRLTVIGAGPELQNLQGQVMALKLESRVQFLGALPQDELARHYRQATLFVAPFVQADSGDQEGLGLVVAEAMACGCPVVVGDVPAVLDLVGDDGGVRVDARNHHALAGAIVLLLKDVERRRALGDEGRRIIEQRFSWDAVSRRYGDLLMDVATERRQ
ncbi:glycosyltransferase family 4 protein [Dyella jiangningensis]|uniref:glycosyltransferase family 4 protein n=1 Tax=Dyella jiangningensis TaxID=1379159 RepID=UPI00240F1F58|nr:glycosyltransferase family 4 protein [Dyella jiangningensis]MDG2537162.1 glycosyltransferase family 4 protein [Dyella jiangningensis]